VITSTVIEHQETITQLSQKKHESEEIVLMVGVVFLMVTIMCVCLRRKAQTKKVITKETSHVKTDIKPDFEINTITALTTIETEEDIQKYTVNNSTGSAKFQKPHSSTTVASWEK
jgi:hypothetical protein